MKKFLVPCLIASCFLLAPLAFAKTDYGIGFGLSLDYATASVYYPNGTAVNIAKIEGSPSYKRAMRPSSTSSGKNDVPLYHTLTLQTIWNAITRMAAQTSSTLHSLLSHLPPWLHNLLPQSPRTRALSRMLQALQTATEFYLQTSPPTTLQIALPFLPSPSQLSSLRKACYSLSLRPLHLSVPPAGIIVVAAFGLGGTCDRDIVKDTPTSEPYEDGRNDPDQLILTVDYSRAAMTAMLVFEGCGVFEQLRVKHETGLGSEALSMNTGDGKIRLVQALKDIATLPLEMGNGAGIGYLNELVVMGEAADDPVLHEALVEVLLEGDLVELDGPAFKTLGKGGGQHSYRKVAVDPVFAASLAAAMDCWDRAIFVATHYEL